MASPPNRVREMLSRYLLPHRGLVGSLTFLLLASNGLQLVTPKIMGAFINTARSDSAMDEVMYVGFLFLGVAIVHQVLAVGARYVSERLAWTATNQLREDLAMHCLRLDMSFHNKRTPGEMIERVDGDGEPVVREDRAGCRGAGIQVAAIEGGACGGDDGKAHRHRDGARIDHLDLAAFSERLGRLTGRLRRPSEAG